MSRYLKGNRSTAAPQYHVCVRVETRRIQDPQIPTLSHDLLAVWSAAYFTVRRGVVQVWARRHGYGADEFWYWFLSLPKSASPIWMWCHGAASASVHLNLWSMIDAGAITYQRGILEQLPFVCWMSSGGRRFRLIDVQNWWRCSIGELSRELLHQPFPQASECTDDSSLLARSEQGCAVTVAAVIAAVQWVREHDLGQFRITVAQQAWHSWRHTYNGPRCVYHDNPEISTHERRGYYGGRVQCFFQGAVRLAPASISSLQAEDEARLPTLYDDRVHVCDIRSQYPSVMAANQMPRAVAAVRESMTVDGLSNAIKHYCVMASVRVCVQDPCVPFRQNGLTIYPTGQWWGVYATPEIAYLLARGAIREVGYTVCYERADLFSEWVGRMYGERKRLESEGKSQQAMVCKILLNSLAGKFGQRSGGWRDRPNHRARKQWGEWMELDADLSRYNVYRGIAGFTQQKIERGESNVAMVAVAAHITSAARIALLRILDVLPVHTVLYCHTDSVHVTDAGLAILRHRGLLRGDQIGDLRLVSTCDDAEYLGTNVYRHGTRYIVAGAPRATVRKGKWLWQCDYTDTLDLILRDGYHHTVRHHARDVELHLQQLGGRPNSHGWVQTPEIVDLRSQIERESIRGEDSE